MPSMPLSSSDDAANAGPATRDDATPKKARRVDAVDAGAVAGLGCGLSEAARPAIAEREATHRAITFAEYLGTPLLVVHVSSAEAAAEISAARARGLAIFGETCPQYLVLTEGCLCEQQGEKFLCSPPLRTEFDQQALWAALRSGSRR